MKGFIVMPHFSGRKDIVIVASKMGEMMKDHCGTLKSCMMSPANFRKSISLGLQPRGKEGMRS